MDPAPLPVWFFDVLNVVSIVVLVYFAALQLVLFSLLILSFFDMRRRLAQNFYADYEAVAKSHFTFPISVLVPAHNESAGIVDSVRSVLSLDYPQHEVIVINDGSTDSTLSELIREFKLTRREMVVRRSLPVTGTVRGIYHVAAHGEYLRTHRAYP